VAGIHSPNSVRVVTTAQLLAIGAANVRPFVDVFYVSDWPHPVAPSSAYLHSDGAGWCMHSQGRSPNLIDLVPAPSGSATVLTALDTWLLPKGLMRAGSYITEVVQVVKDNTANELRCAVYLGPLGTVADPMVGVEFAVIGAANYYGSFQIQLEIETPTTALLTVGCGVATLTDAQRTMTIPDVRTNDLILTLAFRNTVNNTTIYKLDQAMGQIQP
jgi:hypothetical protein